MYVKFNLDRISPEPDDTLLSDPLVIMYKNTIPFLQEYFRQIDNLMLVDMTRNEKPTIMAEYINNEGYIKCYGYEPQWVKELMPMIQRQEQTQYTS
jgi:hypothetical protein